MTPTTNHELLQEHIDGFTDEDRRYAQYEVVGMLRDIQKELIEPMEYEIGKEYEFSFDGKEWNTGRFVGYRAYVGIDGNTFTFPHIRPITISSEIISAISLLEKEGYTITK